MTPVGRILIVDDDELTLEIFAKVLVLEGYSVRLAASALAGLQEAESQRPDAILLDLRMPFVNGAGFLYRLRSNPALRETPVAVITGDVALDHQAWSELENLGADVWFKPLRTDDLVNVTKVLLTKGRSATSRTGG